MLICLVVPSALSAQSLTCLGADITVESGAQLTVKGDMLAGLGATMTDAGTIDISGDVTNNSGSALFAPVAGTLVLNGSNQQIMGANMMKLDNLQLQCAQLTLLQDLAVGGNYASPAGVLALNSTIVQLNAHDLIITDPAANAITRTTGQLVSETGPVPGYGSIEWWIGGSSGAHVIPFGDGVNYLPTTINISTSGNGPGSFVLSTYPTDPFASPNNRPLPIGLSALTDLAGIENAPHVVDRFWAITAPNYLTPPTATLTFSYRDSEWNVGTNTIVESALQAQRFDGIHWSNPPMGVVNTTNNTVTTTVINAFDMVWALAATSTPLPVELLFFNAQPEGSAVLCNWSTASEQNNDFFTVERSRNGEYFEPIGEVDGAGNAQQALNYSFLDRTPYDGLSYYRLRQTDFDGTKRLSQVVPVLFAAEHPAPLIAWPNPCTTVIHLIGADASASITVMDATGRTVIPSTRVTGSIDVSMLAPGSYWIVTQHDHDPRSVRFIKQ